MEDTDDAYGEEGRDPDRRIGRLPARLLPLDFLDRWCGVASSAHAASPVSLPWRGDAAPDDGGGVSLRCSGEASDWDGWRRRDSIRRSSFCLYWS